MTFYSNLAVVTALRAADHTPPSNQHCPFQTSASQPPPPPRTALSQLPQAQDEINHNCLCASSHWRANSQANPAQIHRCGTATVQNTTDRLHQLPCLTARSSCLYLCPMPGTAAMGLTDRPSAMRAVCDTPAAKSAAARLTRRLLRYRPYVSSTAAAAPLASSQAGTSCRFRALTASCVCLERGGRRVGGGGGRDRSKQASKHTGSRGTAASVMAGAHSQGRGKGKR